MQSNLNEKTANRNARRALANLELVRQQKQVVEASEAKAKSAQQAAVKHAAQLKTQADLLAAQTNLLRQSIHSYLKMYLRTCAIGGDIAAADSVIEAKAAFAKFESNEQRVTSDQIAKAQQAIKVHLDNWEANAAGRPDELNFSVLELTRQCRLAWEYRCDSILARKRGGTSDVIRDFERQLIVKELYARAIASARGMTSASDFQSATRHRDEFERIYWGELHFVESERLNSSAVEAAMVRIRQSVQTWTDGVPPENLIELVEELETACRDSLRA